MILAADEMRELQKRLEETERQMSQILNAMQHVSSKVNTVASEAIKKSEQQVIMKYNINYHESNTN